MRVPRLAKLLGTAILRRAFAIQLSRIRIESKQAKDDASDHVPSVAGSGF
jgi:hypothetical protein